MNEIQLARRAPPNVTVLLRMGEAVFAVRRNERGRVVVRQLRSAKDQHLAADLSAGRQLDLSGPSGGESESPALPLGDPAL